MGLLTFLIFAVFFFFLMKAGCGTHVTHGYQDKEKHSQNVIVDPVCGKVVDEDKGYGKLQNGHLYRFCSTECLNKFDNNPDEFTEE